MLQSHGRARFHPDGGFSAGSGSGPLNQGQKDERLADGTIRYNLNDPKKSDIFSGQPMPAQGGVILRASRGNDGALFLDVKCTERTGRAWMLFGAAREYAQFSICLHPAPLTEGIRPMYQRLQSRAEEGWAGEITQLWTDLGTSKLFIGPRGPFGEILLNPDHPFAKKVFSFQWGYTLDLSPYIVSATGIKNLREPDMQRRRAPKNFDGL